MGQFFNSLKRDFSTIPNALVFDNSLSDRARFIFVWMCCKPADWNFFMQNMCEEIGLHEDTIRKCLKELIDRGWIVKKTQVKDDKGHFGNVVYELRQTRKRKAK